MLPLGVRGGCAAIVAGLCYALTLYGQGVQHVPDAVAGAAERRYPETFARALASAEMPAGFILSPDESRYTPLPSLPADAPAGAPSLATVLNRFRDSHPEYGVEQDADGHVFAFPSASRCVAPLERPVVVRYTGPLYVALHQLAMAVDPTESTIPPGIVSGGGRHSPEDGPDLFQKEVVLDVRGGSVRSGLAMLSRGAPGVVWIIRETVNKTTEVHCTLELVTERRSLFTSYRFDPD